MCTANVCRSPRAEYEIREALARVPGFSSLQVESAGTSVTRSDPICDVVREAGSSGAAASTEWADFADAHRSTAISAVHIDQAALILTAGSEHRSVIARMDPAARSRTFTLREALWLGEGYSPSVDGVTAVREFAAFAHAHRGARTPPSARRGVLPWRRETGDPLSIADTHGGAEKAHRATTATVADVASRLGLLITTGR